MLKFNKDDFSQRRVTEAFVVYEGVKRIRDEAQDIFLESKREPEYLQFLEELVDKYSYFYEMADYWRG